VVRPAGGKVGTGAVTGDAVCLDFKDGNSVECGCERQGVELVSRVRRLSHYCIDFFRACGALNAAVRLFECLRIFPRWFRSVLSFEIIPLSRKPAAVSIFM
jgi:hypothetical protein